MLESVLKGVTVAQLMSPAPISVPVTISIQQLVDEYMLPHAVRSVPVVRDGQLAGLITLADVRRVPRERWSQTLVGDVMIPVERLAVAHPTESLNEVLPRMAAPDVNQLPVVEDQRLVGILSRDAILRFIEIRRGLRLDQAERQQQASSQPRSPVGLPA